MLVESVWYRDGGRSESGGLDAVAEAARAAGEGFVWTGLVEPTAAEVADVARVFELHPLAVEDAIKAGQRPKVERYGDWLFVVLRTARYLDETEELDFGEIQLFVGTHAVVVLRRGEPAPLAEMRARLEADPEHLAAGPVAVLHAVVDEVVDGYQLCLTGVDDDVNEVELQVFSDHHGPTSARIVERIYFLQREILELHRAMHPLTTAISHLRSDPLAGNHDVLSAYFRDVDDHLQRQEDQLHTLREVLAATLAANATQISLRQNEDMRRISAWVAMAAVPTMIAGIYGMNFDHMPELGWVGGYPSVLGVMALICLSLHWQFRRSGWL